MFKRIAQTLKQIFGKPEPIVITPWALQQMEKEELFAEAKNTFTKPQLDGRYQHILFVLKYTKHSKKRAKLMKIKKLYEKGEAVNV